LKSESKHLNDFTRIITIIPFGNYQLNYLHFYSLRDCLREAESLRISNQALRDELDNLKQQQELQERFNSAGGSFNVTLNSLNSSATSDLFDGIDTAPNLSTVSSINFTKRGLMITDYDE